MRHSIFTRTLLFLLFITLSNSFFAQAPEGVNYQAVVRNSLGVPLNNQAVNVRFTIHQSTLTGTVVFQETQTTSTNQFGLINLEIGSINTVDFPLINWGVGTYFLQVEVDAGSGFDDLGATQLLSVPYALYAKTSGNGPQGLNSLLDTVSAGASCPNGGYQVLMGLDINSNAVLDAGEITSSFFVCNGSVGTSINWLGSFGTAPAGSTNDAYYNSNDGVSYIFNGSTSTWDTLAAGGVAGMDADWTVAGNDMYSIPTGNVGIGTTTPAKKLSIESNSTSGDGISLNNSSTGNPGLEFQTQGIPRFVMGIDQADNNKFKIGTTNLFTNTRFTINALGNIGIGNSNPSYRLSVSSIDSVIASFVGVNPNVSVISVAGLNPNAVTGAVYLTGADSGIVAMEPSQKTFFVSNTTTNGHISLIADSSVAFYGQVVANIANKVVNLTDSIYSYSTTGTIFNVNQGSFLTDSLYVLGNNAINPNWVLANDGAGQAVWTDPSTLFGSGLWQSNTPDIYFNTGKVGIGTISPQQLLTLSTASSTTLRMERTNATAFDWEMNVDNLGFHLKGGADGVGPALTDFVNVDGFGRMGLGITTPTQLLHLYGGTLRIDDGVKPYNLPSSDGTISGQVMTTDGAGNITWQMPSTGTAMQDSDGDTEINLEAAPDQDVIHFSLGNTTGYPAAEYFTMIGPRMEVINSGQSVFIGQGAGANDDLTLNDNVFIGTGTGNTNTSGQRNVALGTGAMTLNTIGSSNLANGYGALFSNTTGNTNTALGYQAGYSNATGSGNVFLGNQAGYNEIGSDKLYIDNSNTTTPLIYGDFAANALQVNGSLNVNGAYTLPTTDGATSGEVLTTDAAGNVTWQMPSADADWMTSAGIVYNTTDNIGIGTAAPASSLEVEGAAPIITIDGTTGNPRMDFQNTGTSIWQMGLNFASGDFYIRETPTSQVYFDIEQTGEVGIGTLNPVALLEVQGNSPNMMIDATTGNPALYFDEAGTDQWNMGYHTTSNYFWLGEIGVAEHLVIKDGTGNVGLGTNNPLANLHMAADAQDILAIQSSNSIAPDESSMITLDRSRGTKLSPTNVNAGDRLGKIEFAGWNSGTNQFEEVASMRAYADEAYTGGSTASHLEFHVNPSGQSTTIEAMHIKGNGFIGLGTGSPTSKLHIMNGTITIDNGVNPYTLPPSDGAANQVLTTDGSGNVTWQGASGSSNKWDISGNAGTVDGTNFIGTTDNVPLNFRVNNVTAGRIDPTLSNVFYGDYSAYNISTGSLNTYMGSLSGYSNTTGNTNTFIGGFAGYSNVSGNANTMIGYYSGYSNTGSFNTFIGEQAAANNSSGSFNSFMGRDAGQQNTTGGNNTFLGFQAGLTNTTGSNNVIIGYNANVSANNLTNATAIGANATVNISNALILGNGAKVGIGTSAPTELLHLYGGTLRIDDGVKPYNLPSGDSGPGDVQLPDGVASQGFLIHSDLRDGFRHDEGSLED